MTRRIALGGLMGLTALVSAALPARAAPRSWPTTTKIIVRPATAHGWARPGYQVIGRPNDHVDCTHGVPTVSAVDPNIQFCFPTVYGAIACWKSGLPHRALCLSPDLRMRQLVRMPRQGPFAATPLPAPTQRAPLRIVFFNGVSCTMAYNGTLPVRTVHPYQNWVATYYCSRPNLYAWAPPNTTHLGVNEANSTWTVFAGTPSRALTLRHIKRAYFVGTYRA
jgi:hypothetical protein